MMNLRSAPFWPPAGGFRITAAMVFVDSNRSVALSLLLALTLLAGCASKTPMMPAPAVYTPPQAKPLFTARQASPRTPDIELVYITDRAPRSAQATAQNADSEATLPYTAERSASMAYGTVSVRFGEAVDWDTLASQSVAAERSIDLDLQLGGTTELGRFPPLQYRTDRQADGSFRRNPAVLAQHRTAAEGLQAVLSQRIAAAPRKELVLFVHGYANTFQDAAFTMGELCHFFGREFACAIFSWPAGGSRGILMGSNVDRESSDYAVLHLKQALRIVAATPGLERLHLMAHSRGSSLLLSALQLLSIEHYAAGLQLVDRMKLRNLVLLAPDIDLHVAVTQLFGISSDPDLLHGARAAPDARMTQGDMQFTLYASPDDTALSLAESLFGSVRRLGRVDETMFSEKAYERIASLRNFDVIDVYGSTDLFGHSYFHTNPAVSADLVSLIRYGLKAGAPGRPLEEIRKPFWRIRKTGH